MLFVNDQKPEEPTLKGGAPEPDNKTKHGKFYLLERIAFLVVACLSILSTVRTCINEEDISIANYELSSVGNRPLLKLAAPPSITSVRIDTLIVRLKDGPRDHSGDSVDPHLFEMALSLEIESVIRITNMSENSIGKISLLLTAEMVPDFKEFLMGEELPYDIRTSYHKWPELQNSDVLPGDTIQLSSSTKINHMDGQKYVMHFVIVYENEIGHLYHTHSLVPFEFPELMMQVSGASVTLSTMQEILYKALEKQITSNTLARPLDPVSHYESYSKDEAAKAREHLKELRNQ